VSTYFHTHAAYWRELYASEDLQATIIRERHTAVLQWIDDLPLPVGARVLEVGCGAGLLSSTLALRGFSVQAIDLVQEMVEQARSQAAECGAAGRLQVAMGDAQALAFPDGIFDLVVAIGVIPWVDHPIRAIQEMARVTRPGGCLLMSSANRIGLSSQLDPMANPELTSLKRRLKELLARAGHPLPRPTLEYHSNRRIDSVLTQAGLVKMRGRTLGFGPFTLLHRRVLPNSLGLALHHWLQSLADHGVPGFRSTGAAYLAQVRKPTEDPGGRSA
jgi:ubiquinone/menaquinone biosynthesis C-methylase UbiE